MDIDEADLKGNMRKSGRARKAPPLTPKAPKAPPRKKKTQKLKLKGKSSSIVRLLKRQPQGMEYVTMWNYFEEIKINGLSRLVDMHDLTKDLVCFPCSKICMKLQC